MKKFISLLLVTVLALSLFVACGKDEGGAQGADLSGLTAEALIGKIYETVMPEFSLNTMTIDLADADSVSWLTGISDPALLSDAAISEPMMSSQAYSMVLVRVADAAKAEEVAQTMLDNINPAKWVCVEADDIDAAIYGDLVLFVMINSEFGIPAADFVGAFKTLAGGALDKEYTK